MPCPEHSALLQNVALQHPTKNLIGKNTEDCMRNGIVYGGGDAGRYH